MTRQGRTVLASLGAMVVMLALVVGSVPLYQLFCRVTGYGGATRVATAAPGTLGREIRVRFDANTLKDVPWAFTPDQPEITARLGETVLVSFTARNLSDQPVIGTATFNVVPEKAGQYFNKIECFCFTEQRLEPGQQVTMPVQFFVDPALAADENTDEVTTITLSYTFFRAKTQGRPS